MKIRKSFSVIAIIIFVLLIMCLNVSAEDQQYTDNIIPTMTSNTSPSGIASASSITSTTFDAWHAFDKDYNVRDNYKDWSVNNNSNCWLMYEFPTQKIVVKYSLRASYYTTANPKAWEFEGSNDGTNWTVLDSQANISWVASERKEFVISNSNPFKMYRVKIQSNNGYTQTHISELEMMERIQPITTPQNLISSSDDSKVSLTWNAVDGATNYNVKRSTTAGGPYTTIASNVTTASYTDSDVTSGASYYYVVSAVTSNGESANSNEVSTTVATSNPTLTNTASATKLKIGDEFTTDIAIHNVTNICAEDIKVSYDANLFEYVGATAQTGLKIYKEDTSVPGTIRFIVASQGKDNVATGDKNLIQLKFKAKARGTGKVDIVKGRIADNATLEMDVADENCGEATIEVGGKDINRTNSFTLLDLGIDAYYFGFNAADTDTSKYDADIVANGTIDDNDLNSITQSILDNKDYTPNM